MDNQENKMTTQAETKKKGGKLKIVLALVIIAFLALVAYRAYEYFQPKQQEAAVIVNVKTEKAVKETISESAPVTGRIQPVEDVAIVPLAQGQVTNVYVKVGDQVKKGQTLFTIDSSAVAASVSQAKAGLDAAASAYNRMQTLYAEGAVSAQDFESVQAQYKSTKEAYNQASEMLSNYTVTSPINGYVTSLSVSVGSVAGGGMAGSVANVDKLIIETSVAESLAAKINLGDEAEVYVASVGKTFTGKITSFSPIPGLGTLTYPLTITMDDSDEIFAGMFAEVHLVSDYALDALCVSSDAVIVKNGKSVVCVLQKGTTIPEFHEVEVGIDNGERAQILSGISEGDEVVYSGQQYVTEGEVVNVIGSENAGGTN